MAWKEQFILKKKKHLHKPKLEIKQLSYKHMSYSVSYILEQSERGIMKEIN